MSRAFAITASPDAVELAAGASATVTFTVTNNLYAAVRVRVRVDPEAPAEGRWFTVPTDAERNVLPQATEQYAVKVSLPAGTAPGSYRFKLVALSAENPDEDYTEGPSVTVKVPATEQPKKKFPWWILIVLLVVLVGGGVTLAILLSGGGKGLNEPCEDDCKGGLVCVGDPKTCRGDVGFEGCAAAADCNQGLACVEGVCSEPVLPGLGEACSGQCANGLFCVGGTCQEDTVGSECQNDAGCGPGQKCASIGGQRLCLRETGQPCRVAGECLTLVCKQRECTALPLGAACLFPAQCQSNICRDGICKAPIHCPPIDARQCPEGMICRAGTCTFRRWVVDEHIFQQVTPIKRHFGT